MVAESELGSLCCPFKLAYCIEQLAEQLGQLLAGQQTAWRPFDLLFSAAGVGCVQTYGGFIVPVPWFRLTFYPPFFDTV